MGNWFENNPVKSIVAYTILVGGAVFAFSKFILIENTEQYYAAQLEVKNAEISQYEARIAFLESENIKLENDVNKYLEWLQNTPSSILYMEKQNELLEIELEKEQSKSFPNSEESIELDYYREYDSIGENTAIIDETTGVVFSVNNISVQREGDLSFTIPNKDTEYQENVMAGYSREFSIGERNYQLILTSIDYISSRYSVVIKEL